MGRDRAISDAFRVIEGVLRDAGAWTRASVAVVDHEHAAGVVIEVEPVNERACPVSVLGGAWPRLDIWLGVEPTVASLELWADDSGTNLCRLEELFKSVVLGRYEQTVSTGKRDRVRVDGRFRLDERVESHSHSATASAAVRPNERYTIQFEPY